MDIIPPKRIEKYIEHNDKEVKCINQIIPILPSIENPTMTWKMQKEPARDANSTKTKKQEEKRLLCTQSVTSLVPAHKTQYMLARFVTDP